MMTKQEIDKVLALHSAYLNGDAAGERADLREANLRWADLGGADLREANLRGADLGGANLRGADLRGADMSGANLSGANLSGANLCGADLRYASLSGANLRGANLRGADLSRANLRGADLDYSAFPLWCGGTHFAADDRLVAQVLAHLCSLTVSDEARAELDKICEFAKTSHRARECGLLDGDQG